MKSQLDAGIGDIPRMALERVQDILVGQLRARRDHVAKAGTLETDAVRTPQLSGRATPASDHQG